MDFKEPKKRVTKNDKKNQRQVFSQKCIRLKSEFLEKKSEEKRINKPI
jgi:hypothetical protein